jgi:hypothetical protein
MRKPIRWALALSVGLVALLTFGIVWGENPMLFVKRSPPISIVGIDRIISYQGTALGNISGSLLSGCPNCPIVIHAGSSEKVEIGSWWSNKSSKLDDMVKMNWSVVSPYPFDALFYAPPTPPLVYKWNDSVTLFPYATGGWGLALTIVIPYAYSGLPPAGNITFTMSAVEYKAQS